ncbi:MAG TPA: amino acid adenylation domain-containing protein, partial [Blastocatellia bacterium]
MHHLVEAWAHEQPNAIAVNSHGQALSYLELNRRANSLAHRLRAEGTGPESVVAIFIDRSSDWIVAMLAVLKAGGAYVCFETSNPWERIAGMLSDCGARLLLTQIGLGAGTPAPALRAINVDEVWGGVSGYQGEDLPNVADGQNAAYVVYTSGSTGKPKGVVTSHEALRNLIGWHCDQGRIEPEDRASQVAQSGFDAAVWEIWPCLSAGASLSIAGEDTRLSPDELADWLVENDITVSWLPPVLAEPMLQYGNAERLKFKVLYSASDKLLARPGLSAGFKCINVYGPSEAAVATTAGLVSKAGDEAGSPDIGRPLDNIQVYLLDRKLQPSPIGALGQMCITGQSLGRGYLGAPALTAEKFCPVPLGPAGGRIYRTGDLARLKADGRIDFIGRIDHQVKIRGFRVELGEIESALLDSTLVTEAIAVAREGPGLINQLVAYVVPRLAVDGPAMPYVARELAPKLKQHLNELLPEYMVPSTFVVLDKLPRNTNGKVDRKRLPAAGDGALDGNRNYVRPSTPEQEILASIWSRLFGLRKVGIHDDFFDLGGHSLLATQTVSAIARIFNVELSVADLFGNPTISELAEEIGEGRLTGAALPPIEPALRGSRIPLSLSQQRLWFIDQL